MSHLSTIIKPPPGLTVTEGQATVTVSFYPSHDEEEATKQNRKLLKLIDKVLAVANGSSEE